MTFTGSLLNAVDTIGGDYCRRTRRSSVYATHIIDAITATFVIDEERSRGDSLGDEVPTWEAAQAHPDVVELLEGIDDERVRALALEIAEAAYEQAHGLRIGAREGWGAAA